MRIHPADVKFFGGFGAAFATLIGAALYNSTPVSCTVAPDVTFAGQLVDVRHCVGALGLRTDDGVIVRRYVPAGYTLVAVDVTESGK